MTNQTPLLPPRELTLDELDHVSGGFCELYEIHNGPYYSYSIQEDDHSGGGGGGSGNSNNAILNPSDTGDRAIIAGGGLIATGALTIAAGVGISQFDGPLPGPADLVGAGFVVVGALEVAAGTAIGAFGVVFNIFD